MKLRNLFVTALLGAGMLTGCDALMPPKDNHEGEYSDNVIIDQGLKIANLTTLFLQVNDEYDFSNLIYFDEDFEFDINDYTLTSTNTNVLTVENYHVRAVGEGFCYVDITGPGIKEGKSYKQTIFVGKIAGQFVNETRIGTSGLDATFNNDGTFSFSVKEGTYHKDPIEAYSCSGNYSFDQLGFLYITDVLEGEPKELMTLDQILSTFVSGMPLDGVASNVYAHASFEEGVGIKLNVYFHDQVISLIEAE